MTGAEFIAACFWPLIVLFGLLLKVVRDPVLWRWIAGAAGAFGVLYFILGIAYGESSLIAVIDYYLFMVPVGIGLIWYGLNRPKALASKSVWDWKTFAMIPFGALILVVQTMVLVGDFTQPRLVLEGRVTNVRMRGGRNTYYLADIAGRTVKATEPDYERLKFLPVVRAEIGRGSNYIYKIEYLAN